MARRSGLSLLGRAFARLTAQPVKEGIDKETLRLGSKVEKKLNEQNVRIGLLKARKDHLEQKMDIGLEKYKMNEETQASKIKLGGNSILFKYMKHGMVVLIIGTGVLGGKIYNLYA